MKYFISAVFAIAISFVTPALFAAPYLYTFTGSINYIEIDGVYYSDVDFDNDYLTTEDTFNVGEAIEYVFLVDFDLAGFCEGPLSTTYSSTCTGVEIPGSETANYFFASLHSASKLAPATEEGTTFNYGLSLKNLGWLVGDSAVFVVSPYNESVESWVATTDTMPGTMLVGTDAWAGAFGNSPYGRIHSTLELTSIVPYVVDAKKPKKNKRCMKRKGKRKKSHKWRKRCK